MTINDVLKFMQIFYIRRATINFYFKYYLSYSIDTF